jgi:hypothetical protein
MVYRRTQWVSIARRWWVSGRADSHSSRFCASKLVLLGTSDVASAGARNRETKRGGGLLIDLSARF